MPLRRVKWDAKVSSGDRGRKSLMTSYKNWKLCHQFQWKVQPWPPLCFPILEFQNSATNKKIPIIPVSLVRIFRRWLRNLNTSERGFCWLTFVKLMGQPKARSGRAPHRKRWNWGSPGSHPAPCTSPGRTVGREDRSPCASPLSPPKLWHKGV